MVQPAQEGYATVGSAVLRCFLPCFASKQGPTKFPILQDCTGYLMPGTLTLVCGPPGCGKVDSVLPRFAVLHVTDEEAIWRVLDICALFQSKSNVWVDSFLCSRLNLPFIATLDFVIVTSLTLKAQNLWATLCGYKSLSGLSVFVMYLASLRPFEHN
jgi:hypothetical protein